MTDYIAGTGTSGQLIIRDTGLLVQAIIVCNNSATYVYGAGWQVNLGAGAASGSFDINGVTSIVVWQGNVTTTTSMSFSMGATGTSGLGGPAQVGPVTISRATVPSVVRSVNITNVLPTSLKVNFTAPASNGGATIQSYLIRISKNNPPNVLPYTDKTGNSGTVLTGLSPGVKYYVTVYAKNSVGYSLLSPAVGARTLGPLRIKIGGVWRLAMPYVKVAGVWKMAIPYIKTGGVWKLTQ